MAYNPGSQSEAEIIADIMADESFAAVNRALEHTVRAAELTARIEPLTDGETRLVTATMAAGPLAYACPAVGKVIMNSARYALAVFHSRAARNLLAE